MASTLKVTNIDTPDGTGSITFDRPIAGDGSSLTGISNSGLENDISILALNSAIQNNQTAHGLNNSWIEQFEDSTFIDNLSSVSRVTADEYVASVYSSSATVSYTYTNTFNTGGSGNSTVQTFTSIAIGTAATNRHVIAVIATGVAGNSPLTSVTIGGVSATEIARGEGGDSMKTHLWIAAVPTGTTATVVITQTATSNRGGLSLFSMYGGGATATDTFTSGSTSVSGTIDVLGGGVIIGGVHSNHATMPTHSWTGITERSDGQTNSVYAASTASDAFASAETGRAISIAFTTVSNTGTAVASFPKGAATANATGSFTSTAIVPQDATNKSSVGLVILYKEQAGSTTLNTNLVAKCRANTGQAYQTLTLADKGTFSTGIKIAIAPAIAVTAGQALSYEISFAGQSASLETRVYGVSLQY